MHKSKLLIALLICNITLCYASNQAKFSLVATTGTSISVPSNRNALVQYRVTNNTNITRTLTIVPIPYTTQRSVNSNECTSPFTLAHGQSCYLTLEINGAQVRRGYTGGPIVCKTRSGSNTPDRFLCSQPEREMVLSIRPAAPVTPSVNKLYVSNWDGNSISLCYINGSSLQYCHITALSDTFANPEALAVNSNVLFVANIGGGISSCVIEPVTGELLNCQNAVLTPNAPIYAPDGIAIDGGKAYISDSGPAQFKQGVTVCDMSGSFLNNCSFTQGDASFSVPSDLAITENTVYITNFNSPSIQTTYCTIADPLCTTGSGEGTIAGTGSLLNEPEGLFFSTLNGINYAWFTNHGNNSITLCQVQSANNFTNCAMTQGYFSGFGNLAILSNSLLAFIPSGLKNINICNVNASDGTLSNCINSSETNFNNPSGLLIQSS